MKHYVLLKFKKGQLSEEISVMAQQILGKLVEAVEEIKTVTVHTNCVNRQDNYDLMVEMDLANKETLQTYLDHPYHKEFIEYVKDKVEAKVSFDYYL